MTGLGRLCFLFQVSQWVESWVLKSSLWGFQFTVTTVSWYLSLPSRSFAHCSVMEGAEKLYWVEGPAPFLALPYFKHSQLQTGETSQIIIIMALSLSDTDPLSPITATVTECVKVCTFLRWWWIATDNMYPISEHKALVANRMFGLEVELKSIKEMVLTSSHSDSLFASHVWT